jgi:4-amino-4-deoxy-L-arabinose transferase-like glycosyltransferase
MPAAVLPQTRLSRPWLVVVLALFCAPLFLGLGRADLDTDEAIYSFAVDRILEVGDWLQPKSSPSETAVFLEKPPLKFWIVAAPIRAGLLPHDEFGLRFWDAVLGAIAFVYVFAIGSMLAGPVCGAVAVLVLLVHEPLMLTHGLRANNMEAPLFLAYCGGMWHFFRWSQVGESAARRRHAVAVGLFFVLGFLTKFVAAIFLPLVLGIGIAAFPRCRQRFRQDVRTWVVVALLVIALSAPWFIYAHVTFGRGFWNIIFSEHVVHRLRAYLDPAHVQPWDFYFTSLYETFAASSAVNLVAAGLVALLVAAVRTRWVEAALVVLWAVVPIVAISFGTSKLYHYAYPFLPPLAIGAGYLFALVIRVVPGAFGEALEWIERQLASRLPRLADTTSSSGFRRGARIVIWTAAALAVATVILGRVRITLGDTVLFKNSDVLRPILLILALALVTRQSARFAWLAVALFVLKSAPVTAYPAMFPKLLDGKHPLRTASECVQEVAARQPSTSPRGLYVDSAEEGFWHPVYYYFRRIRPWTRAVKASPETVDRYLHEAGNERPILIPERRYREYFYPGGRLAGRDPSPPLMSMIGEHLLLLPGPYGACVPTGR